MWPYLLLFAVPARLAAIKLKPVPIHPIAWSSAWRATFIFLVLMIGLRYRVGGDWFNYTYQIEQATGTSLREALSNLTNDLSYTSLNWIAANMGFGGIYFANTVCAVLFSWGLMTFCWAQPRPWLALTVAVPYLIIVVAMGYTRQSVAIGLVMMGLVALSERKTLRFVVFIILAATFHKTAVVLMPLAVLASSKNRIWTALWVGMFTVLFYKLLLQDAVSGLRENYLGAQYESSGAAIRVAMNAVPAALFLIFRRRFDMAPANRAFWTWMSLGALGFVVLLKLSPSSTAVDRIALYWIPLQLLVLSRLPNALGTAEGKNAQWVYAVVAYSMATLLTWLLYAQNAPSWLPYQFYPWAALWT